MGGSELEKEPGQLLPKLATKKNTLFTISKGKGAAKMFPEINRTRFHLPDPLGPHLFHVPQSTHATMVRRKKGVPEIKSCEEFKALGRL